LDSSDDEMSEQDRRELIEFLRERISRLPNGPFKRRMEVRVKLLEEVPREAWIALGLMLLLMLGIWVYAKWAWRLPKYALAVL